MPPLTSRTRTCASRGRQALPDRKATYAELEYLRARKQKSSKGQTIALPCTDEEEEFDPPAGADVVAGSIGESANGSAKPSNGR
jgi:hypothetical protein